MFQWIGLLRNRIQVTWNKRNHKICINFILSAEPVRILDHIKQKNLTFYNKIERIHRLNEIINDKLLRKICLTFINNEKIMPMENSFTKKTFGKFSENFRSKFSIEVGEFDYELFLPNLNSVIDQIKSKTVRSRNEFVLIFICVMRLMGIECRLLKSFDEKEVKVFCKFNAFRMFSMHSIILVAMRRKQ